MPVNTPNLALPFLLASQADKHVSVNSALSTLDAVVQPSVISRSVATQPASPAIGDAYLLPTNKTGADWAGMAPGTLAVFTDTGWLQFMPKIGFILYIQSEGQLVVRGATGWGALGAQAPVANSGEVLLNGAMGVWQRGTALTLSAGQSGYLADRWRHEAGAGGVAAVSRIVAGAGTNGLPEWAYHGVRHAQTTAASVAPRIEQRLESLRRFGAGTITFSAFVRVLTGTATLTPRAVLNFGSGGPAAQSVNAPVWNLTTTWQRLSATFTVPSIAGTTALEWASNYLSIGVDLPTGAVLSVDICAAQIDMGATMAPLRIPDQVNELARCQRYFAKTFAADTTPAPNTSDGGGVFQSVYSAAAFANIIPWRFPTPMRAIPQIATFNPYNATGTGMSLAGGGNFVLDTYAINQNGVMLRNTTVLSGAPLPVNLHVTATAEL